MAIRPSMDVFKCSHTGPLGNLCKVYFSQFLNLLNWVSLKNGLGVYKAPNKQMLQIKNITNYFNTNDFYILKEGEL